MDPRLKLGMREILGRKVQKKHRACFSKLSFYMKNGYRSSENRAFRIRING